MKIGFAVCLSLFFFSLSASAQDSSSHVTRIERIGYVAAASVGFSLFDYLGYNAVRKNNRAPFWYRAIQTTVQVAISYLLYDQLGLTEAIAFNLIWWSWADDLGFYGLANLINPARPDGSEWENREHNGLRDDRIEWAGWTPIGLLRPYGSRIPRDALIAQSIAGVGISVAILW